MMKMMMAVVVVVLVRRQVPSRRQMEKVKGTQSRVRIDLEMIGRIAGDLAQFDCLVFFFIIFVLKIWLAGTKTFRPEFDCRPKIFDVRCERTIGFRDCMTDVFSRSGETTNDSNDSLAKSSVSSWRRFVRYQSLCQVPRTSLNRSLIGVKQKELP
jgi:hypothetical protein